MKELIRVIREFLALVLVGLAIGLVANAANPNGLLLTKNYFAKPIIKRPDTRPANDTRPGGNTTKPATTPATQMTEEEMVQKLKEAGFQALSHDEVLEIYNSPYRTDGMYLIIDARNDDLYKEGHIPGAYQWDHYYVDKHPEKYVDPVMKAYRIAEGVEAEKIVVYCNGGECEDSELAVGDLLGKGIPLDKLFIYAGGFTMWREKGAEFETGERNSGQLTRETPKTGGQTNQGAAK